MPIVCEVQAQVCDPSHRLIQWLVVCVLVLLADSRHFDVVSPMIRGSEKAVRCQTANTKYSLSKALPENSPDRYAMATEMLRRTGIN